MSWVACCVAFGGSLFTYNFKKSILSFSGKFYWNYMTDTGSDHRVYSDGCPMAWDFCNACDKGGKAFLAFQIFAFLCLLAVMVLSIIRIIGASVAFLEPTRKSLFF